MHMRPNMQHLVVVERGATLPPSFASPAPDCSIFIQDQQESAPEFRERLWSRLGRSDARSLKSVELLCSGGWSPQAFRERRHLGAICLQGRPAPTVSSLTVRAQLVDQTEQHRVLQFVDDLSALTARPVAFNVKLDVERSGVRYSRPVMDELDENAA